MAITKTFLNLSIRVSMLTMGEKSAKACCEIACTCQGPLVYVKPILLDFGQVQVLREKSIDLLVINDSPITARFKLAPVRLLLPSSSRLWIF